MFLSLHILNGDSMPDMNANTFFGPTTGQC